MPIKETAEKIRREIEYSRLAAGTALGPAVALSVSMATQGQKGSRVVICTDGQPTVGIGYYSKRFTPEQVKYTDQFYEDVGELAQSSGVMIDIITIEGDECNIDSISKLSELTGGNIDRVSPHKLADAFSNQRRNPIIATNVEA